MTTTASKRAAALCALLATTSLASPVLGQSSGAPPFRQVDENGVDLTHGDYVLNFVEGSIGSGKGELKLIRRHLGDQPSQWDDIRFRKEDTSGIVKVTLQLGTTSETFTKNGTAYVAAKANGSSLTDNGGQFTHTAADGTVILFTDPTGHPQDGATNFCSPRRTQSYCELVPTTITTPDAAAVTLDWTIAEQCSGESNQAGGFDCTYYWRLNGISNSLGYAVAFSYVSANAPANEYPGADWFRRSGATLGGNPVTYARPTTGVIDVTDMAGRTWRLTGSSGPITGIRRPGAVTNTTSIAYSAGKVSSVIRDGTTTSYARTVAGNIATLTKTNALNQQTIVTSDMSIGRPISIKDALNRTTAYQYDSAGRLTRVTAPEGNYIQYTLDARGNVTQTTAVAKAGSGLASIVTSAVFPASCSNPKSCNQPTSTTDAGGNVTNYEYDAAHGGVTKLTTPAAAPGGVRPQTRYGYTLLNGEHQLTSVSACRTTAATGTASVCGGGTADEVRTTFVYDAQGNIINASSGAGDGSLTATSIATYDAKGDLLTADGPLAGSADTVRYRYNAGRELIGVIGPDPDGAGAAQHRAQRLSYNADGQVTKVERGSVNSQSDADWAGFASLETVETGYDAHARPVTQKLVAGGATHALTQMSYDALGRPECSVVRMNPAAFGSLPASACTLGAQGSHGPDRIGKTVYDVAGQVTQVTSAFGVVGQEANEVATSYRPNGQPETLTDAEGNRTTYEYDGHDRLLKTRFPSPTTDGVSSTTDYEQLSYDSRGNVTQRRLRDGQVIGYGYDNLSRLVAKDVPNIVAYEYDVSYAYDLLGRLTSATDSNTHFANLGYDALGRLVSESSNFFGRTHQYDLAGRRTRLTHSDGFFVSYDYNLAGDMTAVRENGSATLASFAYDDLGRRVSLTRGNGTVTSYGYDPASRLTSLSLDLSGSTYDHNVTLGYNPAGQITSRTGSNDAFAWTGHANAGVTDTVNGLNQLTAAGGAAVSHDGRGNTTGAGGASYVYTSENRMASGGGALFAHDPLGRMHQLFASNTVLQYDGQALIVELAGLWPIAKRYVHGPGVDEVLVEYAGPGTADKRWLHADERGSVVALSDANGNVTAVNKYDEYGSPQGTLAGRFGYTGQAWLPEIGLSYYKARMYDPRGRFMQTDPIGYAAGMNLYDYVQGDPVNSTDPLGLCGVQVSDAQGNFVDRRCPPPPPVNSGGFAYVGNNGGDPKTKILLEIECRLDPECILVQGKRAKPPLKRDAKPSIEWPCNVANNFCEARTSSRSPEGPTRKKDSYPSRCLGNAVENYANGRAFNSAELAFRDASRAGMALNTDPMKTGGLNFGEFAKAVAGLPLFNMGYYIGRSCPQR